MGKKLQTIYWYKYKFLQEKLDEKSNDAIKLNSYSNASVFLSLCRMRISVFFFFFLDRKRQAD